MRALRPGLLWFLVFLAGCGTDDLPPMPPAPTLQGIRGQMRLAGEGTEADLWVGRVDQDLQVYSGMTEADGTYSVPLPPGRYVVYAKLHSLGMWYENYAYSASGPTDPAWADTLTVTNSGAPIIADFDFAKVRFRVSLPEENGGYSVQVIAYRRLPDGRWDSTVSQQNSSEFSPISFILLPVPVGECVFRLSIANDREALYLPRAARIEEAEVYPIGPGDWGPYEVNLDLPVAVLRGGLRGAWRSSDPNQARLEAFNEDSVEVAHADVRSDEDGSFALAFPFAERVRLRLRLSSTVSWVGGLDYATATEFALTRGDTTEVGWIEETGLNLRIDAPLEWLDSPIVYTVVDERGGRLEEGPRWLGNEDRLLISGLTPGRYRVGVRPYRMDDAPWSPVWYENADTEEEATYIELHAGDPYRSIVLRPSGRGAVRRGP